MSGAEIPVAMMAVSTIISAAGQAQAGKAAAAQGTAEQQALDYKAQVGAQQAGQVRAASTGQVENEAQNLALVQSTLRSKAAASGAGGMTDPTVANLSAGVAGRGQYNALSALFTGEEKARGLESQSALDIYQGDQAVQAGRIKQQAGNIGAVGALFGGGGSLYAKYGMGAGGGASAPPGGGELGYA
jgi:hypothetical protein